MKKGTKDIVKLQPTWKNEPSYGDLNNDVDGMSGIQTQIREDLVYYKLLKDGGKEVTVQPGKSSMRPKVVRKLQEWKYASLEEPFLNTPRMYQVDPRAADDVFAAKQNSIMLNYQYETLIDRVKLVGDSVRTYVDEGTIIVKTGWEVEYDDVEVEVEAPVYASAEESLALMQDALAAGRISEAEMQAKIASGRPVQTGTKMKTETQKVLTKNQPKHEILDNANVGIDPTCQGDLTKAKFIWHEYETSYADLVKNKFVKNEDGTTSGYYKNIDKAIVAGLESQKYNLNDPVGVTEFLFSDKARKKVKAIEYWGYWDIQGDGKLEPIVAEWVNEVLIRLELNPFPHKRLPFSSAQYMPVIRDTRGIPDAKLIAENQESIGKLVRAAHDITSTAAVGQEFIDNNFFVSPSDKNQYEKGNTVYYNSGMDPKRSIHRRSVDPIDPSVFNMIQANTAEAETLTGTKPFDGGGGSGAGLGLAKISLDSAAKRDLSILRRLSTMFIDMGRMVISMNKEYLDEEQIVRVTNDKFVPVKRDDLEGNIDLRLGISTPEKDAQQAQSLMTLLQTNAASMDPELYKIVMGKILRLQYHPDLADKVEQFQPKPDEKQQQLMDLQIENARLENEKLKAEMVGMQSVVHERATRGTENMTADIKNKLAQAELRAAQAELAKAQAEKASSESDLLDQNYLDSESGLKDQRAFKEREHKSVLKQEEEQSKIAQNAWLKGGSNAGIR